jgi:hypothetical protein
MIHHELQIFAAYHQFYLWDGGMNCSAPEDYTDEDVRNMVKVAPNVVVIQAVRNMTVPVEIEVHKDDPGVDMSCWDHVAECGLDLPTGRLHVEECTGGAVLTLKLSPGSYRVRALFACLGELSDDGLDGNDWYRVVLWPGPIRPLLVAKQWGGGRSR